MQNQDQDDAKRAPGGEAMTVSVDWERRCYRQMHIAEAWHRQLLETQRLAIERSADMEAERNAHWRTREKLLEVEKHARAGDELIAKQAERIKHLEGLILEQATAVKPAATKRKR